MEENVYQLHDFRQLSPRMTPSARFMEKEKRISPRIGTSLRQFGVQHRDRPRFISAPIKNPHPSRQIISVLNTPESRKYLIHFSSVAHTVLMNSRNFIALAFTAERTAVSRAVGAPAFSQHHIFQHFQLLHGAMPCVQISDSAI